MVARQRGDFIASDENLRGTKTYQCVKLGCSNADCVGAVVGRILCIMVSKGL